MSGQPDRRLFLKACGLLAVVPGAVLAASPACTNLPSLPIQLHHEYPGGSTEVQSQTVVPLDLDDVLAFLRAWKRRAEASHPLPVGCRWLFVMEGSEHFVWAVALQRLKDMGLIPRLSD